MAGDAMNDRRFRLLFAPLILALSACGAAPKEAPPLEGARIGGPFTLTDQNGRSFSDGQLAGKWRIMYFGYTFCPDVCPVDLQKIGAGMKALEASDPAVAAKITPVFVTVDPKRDTAPIRKEFVANFHPRMVGLGGSPEVTDRVAKEYGVYYRLQPPGPGGGYLVDHTRQAVLFGPDGKPIALIPTVDKSPAEVAAELKRWVA